MKKKNKLAQALKEEKEKLEMMKREVRELAKPKIDEKAVMIFSVHLFKMFR